MRSAAVGRRLNLPPSYVLIHRVSTAGIGVLCQLECEGQFRAEVLRWMPGYQDAADPSADTDDPGTEDPGTEDPGTHDPGTEDPGDASPAGTRTAR